MWGNRKLVFRLVGVIEGSLTFQFARDVELRKRRSRRRSWAEDGDIERSSFSDDQEGKSHFRAKKRRLMQLESRALKLVVSSAWTPTLLLRLRPKQRRLRERTMERNPLWKQRSRLPEDDYTHQWKMGSHFMGLAFTKHFSYDIDGTGCGRTICRISKFDIIAFDIEWLKQLFNHLILIIFTKYILTLIYLNAESARAVDFQQFML